MPGVSISQTDRAYSELSGRLADGRFRRGDRLPAERELSRELGVSRVTLRRAIARLRDEQALHAIRGAGTFVTSPMIGEVTNDLLSFSLLAQARGLVATALVLGFDVRAATLDESERYGVAAGSSVFDLERLRLLDGIPVAVSRSTVPSWCAPTLSTADWAVASIYEELSRAGNPPVRADYTIEAQAADHVTASWLKLSTGQPVLVTSSVSYSADARVVELGRIIYRGDRYRFRTTLHA